MSSHLLTAELALSAAKIQNQSQSLKRAVQMSRSVARLTKIHRSCWRFKADGLTFLSAV